MTTRKQIFEESMTMKIHYLDFSGVTFLNFPAQRSPSGDLGYDCGMIQVAQEIAEKVPESLRPAVTVDFDKIPAWEMRERILEKSYGGPLPKEHELGEASQRLLDLIGADTE